MDVGILRAPLVPADIAREQVVLSAGTDLKGLLDCRDRRLAVETMVRGGSGIVRKLHEEGKFSGILGVGGGTGTHIGTGIMRTLPLGVPKLMVSTVASRDVSSLIGTKDSQ